MQLSPIVHGDCKEIVTIDGPAGAGKSTVGKELARRLGFTYLDTGAMYRAVAWAAQRAGIDCGDEDGLKGLCGNLRLQCEGDRIAVNGRDISDLIRTPEMDSLASAASRIQAVRQFLGRLQQEMGRRGKVVAEGRDMGTVVFPCAAWKFYLTATAQERARRRQAQLEALGQRVEYQSILAQIQERDSADSNRVLAPLRPASDATCIDSSDLTISEILGKIINIIRKG